MDTVSRSAKVPDLNSRRQLLLAAAALLLLPGRAIAAAGSSSLATPGQADTAAIGWAEFLARMNALADAHAYSKVDQQVVVADGLRNLQQLDIGDTQFQRAIEDAYETGNRYWLWQRMIKQQNINGGILNISSGQLVQLHDHPGATGLLRIIEGEAEVWQFDATSQSGAGETKTADNQPIEQLIRVSHAILTPGDTAVLTPEKGNIHALRSVSRECRMLDFFIPPYQRNQRSWYEPLVDDWFDKETIACRRIPQDAYEKV